WLVEGCRIAQPLEPLMGSQVTDAKPPAPRALVSVQACLEIDGRPMLLGAPALLGGRGQAAGPLGQPFCRLNTPVMRPSTCRAPPAPRLHRGHAMPSRSSTCRRTAC